MENEKFRLPKQNLYLIGIGVLIIIIGLILMAVGPVSEYGSFEPEIFSTRRIVVGPVVAFIGFVSIIGAILYTRKNKNK